MATLNDQLSAALKKANELKTQFEKDGWNEERRASFSAAIGEAQAVKRAIEDEAALKHLSDYAAQPDGTSAVRQSWSGSIGEAREGVIDGVSQTRVDVDTHPLSGRKSATGGELYAVNGVGEARLKALKSGQYRDAVAAYVRSAALGNASAMKGDAMKILQEGIDSSGGFWVPPDMRSEVVKKSAVGATIRPSAYSFTVGSDVAIFPKVNYTTDDKYTSGVRFAWTAEAPAADVSESTNPVAGEVRIPIYTAIASIVITRAQAEDNSFDLLGYISELLGEAFMLGEEDAFTNGDGVGKPQGILNHPNLSVASTSGGMYVPSGAASALAWGTDGLKGVTGLEGALPPQYEMGAGFMANKKTFAALRALNTGSAGIQWTGDDYYPNARNGFSPSLLGYQKQTNQFLPDVAANAYPMLLGNMRGYFIADRVGLSIEVLREVKALRDMIVVYARKRVGGQLVRDWQVKALKVATS